MFLADRMPSAIEDASYILNRAVPGIFGESTRLLDKETREAYVNSHVGAAAGGA